MMRFMFKSKIHRATVTATDQDYEGSITVDADLPPESVTAGIQAGLSRLSL